MESTVVNVLSKPTNVCVTADNIEACRKIAKFKGNSKNLLFTSLIGRIGNLILIHRKKTKII